MIIEVRIRILGGGMVTRHYVLRGCERALCGQLTLRPPTDAERHAYTCRRCTAHETALRERS